MALEDVLVRGDPDVVAVPGARPDPFAKSLGDGGGGRILDVFPGFFPEAPKFKMETSKEGIALEPISNNFRLLDMTQKSFDLHVFVHHCRRRLRTSTWAPSRSLGKPGDAAGHSLGDDFPKSRDIFGRLN